MLSFIDAQAAFCQSNTSKKAYIDLIELDKNLNTKFVFRTINISSDSLKIFLSYNDVTEELSIQKMIRDSLGLNDFKYEWKVWSGLGTVEVSFFEGKTLIVKKYENPGRLISKHSYRDISNANSVSSTIVINIYPEINAEYISIIVQDKVTRKFIHEYQGLPVNMIEIPNNKNPYQILAIQRINGNSKYLKFEITN